MVREILSNSWRWPKSFSMLDSEATDIQSAPWGKAANMSTRIDSSRMPPRMARPRNDLIDRLQYIGLRIASMLMHCWPVDANLKLARMLGDAVYRLDRKHRQRAIHNL